VPRAPTRPTQLSYLAQVRTEQRAELGLRTDAPVDSPPTARTNLGLQECAQSGANTASSLSLGLFEQLGQTPSSLRKQQEVLNESVEQGQHLSGERFGDLLTIVKVRCHVAAVS